MRKKVIRWLECFLGSLVLVLYFSYPVIYAYRATRPAPSDPGAVSPADFGQPYEEVNLAAPDGANLSGWYIPARNQAAVILLHGYGSSRVQMLHHAEILARHGFGVLLYDQRASGLSGGNTRSFGWQDLEDLAAVVGYLKTRPDLNPHRLGIAGLSTGAEIALGAPARYPELGAVLADGAGFPVQEDMLPPTNLEEYSLVPLTPILFGTLRIFSGVQPPPPLTRQVARIAPRPLLLIATATSSENRQAQMYFQLAGEPKSLWYLPDSQHCAAVFTHPQEYETRMVSFFEQALLEK